MSQALNTVALVGRLTRPCEMRYTSSGFAICSFSIAVNRRKKSPDGSWNEVASFFDCTYFGKGAEAVSQYLVKGQQVSIQGSLEQQTWESNGQKRSKVVVIVNSLSLLGSQKQGNQGQSYNNTPRQQNYKPQEQYQAHSNQNNGQNYQNQGNLKPVYNNAPENFESDDFDGSMEIPF